MDTLPVTSGLAPVADGQLYYEVIGEGPPLVLVHGGMNDRRMWDDHWTAFAQHYRVVRYDLRGVGQSPRAEAPFYNETDLAALLGHLGLARAGVIGQSLGGRVAINFALAYPERTAALVLVGTGVDGYEWVGPEMLASDPELDAAFAAGDLDRAVEIGLAVWIDGPGRTAAQVDPAVRARCAELLHDIWSQDTGWRQMQEPVPAAITRLEEITAPTLVVVGDHDVSDIQMITDLLVTRVPGAHKVVLPNAAHAVNMERPQEFNQVVLDFLHSLPAW